MSGTTKQTNMTIAIGLRIKTARLRRGAKVSEFAKSLGVTASTVSNWEAGRCAFHADLVYRLAGVLGVSPGFLLDGIERDDGPWMEVITLPRCDMMGWGSVSKVAVKVRVPPEVQGCEDAFAVIAVGTSMQPEGIREGYVLFCDPAREIVPGDAVFVKTRDGRVTVKRFLSENGEFIQLQGWKDPDLDGRQEPFYLDVLKEYVEVLAAVVTIQRKA